MAGVGLMKTQFTRLKAQDSSNCRQQVDTCHLRIETSIYSCPLGWPPDRTRYRTRYRTRFPARTALWSEYESEYESEYDQAERCPWSPPARR